MNIIYYYFLVAFLQCRMLTGFVFVVGLVYSNIFFLFWEKKPNTSSFLMAHIVQILYDIDRTYH